MPLRALRALRALKPLRKRADFRRAYNQEFLRIFNNKNINVIVSAALESNCHLLYSEDMQDGLKIGSLTIRNIFAD